MLTQQEISAGVKQPRFSLAEKLELCKVDTALSPTEEIGSGLVEIFGGKCERRWDATGTRVWKKVWKMCITFCSLLYCIVLCEVIYDAHNRINRKIFTP